MNNTYSQSGADQGDTIAAVATATGTGGIAIVRISGPRAEAILQKMFIPASRRDSFRSHMMMYGRAVDDQGHTLDEVMAVLMRAPSTYTREDVAEIHCHGGRISASLVLARAVELGAGMAQPGEFTRRAYMNGRIDLARAEAVMQLVGAGSRAAARASVRQLEGGVSGFIHGVVDRLTDLLAALEASTDFPEEIEEEAAARQIVEGLSSEIDTIRSKSDVRHARLVREGASIVLAGRPNVGKSSLMNALLEQERAIVTDIPGTTRDVLTERIDLDGVMAEIADTAGRRDTDNPIEKIGVERAEMAEQSADVVLIVLDAAQKIEESDIELLKSADERALVCLNKTDLRAEITTEEIKGYTQAPVLEISALSGQGLRELKDALKERISSGTEMDGLMTARRHVELAQRAVVCLERAVQGIEAGMPLDTAAIDMREALSLLTQITGENATEAVIDRVFANFCVGK